MLEPIYYNNKTITSGGVIEQLVYEKQVSKGFKVSQKVIDRRKSAKFRQALDLTPEEIKEKKTVNRKLSMLRAKKNLTRLINSNIYQYFKPNGKPYPPVFLTLTFKEDIRDQKTANELFSLFIKRLNYEVTHSKINTLKYSVVVEFQDKTRNGVIHYHVIFYNLPFIKTDTLSEIWNHGFLKINEVNKSKSISNYVTKYMSKNFEDDRLDGHKRYFSSRGLIKPKTYLGLIPYETVRKIIPTNAKEWQKEYDTEKKGKVLSTIFTLGGKKDFQSLLTEEDRQELRKYDLS